MRTILCLFTLIAAPCFAGQVSTIIDDRSGALDTNNLQSYLEWADPHLREYPPRFSSEDEKKRLYLSTLLVSSEIKKLDIAKITDVDVLVSLAQVMSMGHNLDLDTALHAKSLFETALQRSPDSVRANYLFGMFLISTSQFYKDSERYLTKALELGQEDARYSLGLFYFNTGDKAKGIQYVRTYAEKHPGNDSVTKMLHHMENDQIQLKQQ